MKQKINVLIIWIIAITILVVSFIFAINHKKESINNFYDSGYIISNSYQSGFNNVNKLYFEEETYYKQFNKDTYTFTNSEGEKVSVSEESFVHYSNGSIMSLKKGVAIDLEKIDSKLISYYNVFAGSTLIKQNEVYEIENLNNIITFSKLMFKISDNKYLIAAPKIIVSFSDDQTVEVENYAEIEYVDKNVIRIYNDKVNYQTIASELYLMIDNIKIDLEYKTISKNDIEYLTMADMIINSNDNIEILPEKPEVFTPGEVDSSDNGGNNNNSGGNNTGGEIDSGIEEGLDNIIGNLPQIEDKEEKEEIQQPKFKVDSINVTTLGFENLNLSFEDESSILYGDRTVEILENSTGKVVAVFEQWEEGVQEYNINSYFDLKPNTAYTLNVVGQYKIDEVVYDRTFISKIFRTLDIGIEITNDYITDESLSFAIYRNSYSEVNGFSYNITDKNENLIVEDKKVSFSSSDKVIITENEKFNSNTEYILTIKDILYGNDIFSTVAYQKLELTHEVKTLKVNPFKISDIKLKGNVDSIKNEVTFTLDGINDINGGIQNYVYNIYNSIGEIKQTISKDDSTPVTLSFENLENEDNIYFNVAINFDDNEKTVMFISQDSDLINLSGVSYPKIVDYIGATNNTDSEKLIGEILIDDAENFIASKGISTYKIDIKKKTNSLLGGTEQFVGSLEIQTPENFENIEGSFEIEIPNATTTQYALPIYFEGLYPNTEYILYVYLLSEGKYIYIGYEDVKTEATKPVYLNINLDDELENTEAMFDFKISTDTDNKNNSLDYLKQINLDLYRCSANDETICEKTNFSTTIPKSQDTEDFAELYNLIYNDKTLAIDAYRFGFYIEDYIAGSVYKVVITSQSYRYEIPVKLKIDEKETDINEFFVELNNVSPNLSIVANDILNFEQEVKKEEIDDNTIVGFEFEINSKTNPMGQGIENVSYSIFEAKSYDEKTNTCEQNIEAQSSAIITKDVKLESISDKKEQIYFEGNNLYRGVHYCMVYKGTYTGNDGNEADTSIKTLHFFAPKQSVELKGYIKNYDGKSLTANLNIDDPDGVLENIELSNDNQSITAQKGENNEYKFKNLEYKSYVLKITENLGDESISHKIYDVVLDDIVNMDNINIIVDTRSPGKIVLKVPYVSDTDDEINEITITNGNLRDNLNRISAMGIEDNKDSNTSIRYFELIDSDAGYLYTEIGLTEIDNDLRKIGQIVNGVLTLNKIYLLYDSGKIVDYINDTNSFFIKSKNEGLNDNYFSKNKYDFTYISNNSIFNINDFGFDNEYKKWNLKENVEISLLSNTFNSINENYGSIGIFLNVPNKLQKTVNFNEISKTSSATLYDFNNNEKTQFEVLDVLSTSDIKTVYTSTGANISFNIENKKIEKPTNLIVKLNKSGANVTELSITLNSCNESGCVWEKDFVEGSNEIKKIFVNGRSVEIYFDGIRDEKYSYSLDFEVDETTMSTYNAVKKENNTNITITALEKLYLKTYDVQVQKRYWKWNENYTNLDFIKQITYSFVVDNTKYKLKDNEQMVYKIIAKKEKTSEEESDKTFYIAGSADEHEDISNNSGSADLYKINYEAGIYEVILKSEIKNSKTGESINLEDIGLKKILLTKAIPSFSVDKIADPILGVEIKDEDGMLIACDDYENSETMAYIDQGSETYYTDPNNGRKVVYLELYSINAETKEETFVGYSPIPFTARTSRLDLTKYFEQRNLKTGDYKVKIQYCVSGNKLTWEGEPLRINNLSGLKIELVDIGVYFLAFHNPDPLLKDSIQEIEYQYQTYTDDKYVVKKLSNLDNITSNDINYYTSSGSSDGGTLYFLNLPVDGVLTSQIKNLQIVFKSSDGKTITTYYK